MAAAPDLALADAFRNLTADRQQLEFLVFNEVYTRLREAGWRPVGDLKV